MLVAQPRRKDFKTHSNLTKSLKFLPAKNLSSTFLRKNVTVSTAVLILLDAYVGNSKQAIVLLSLEKGIWGMGTGRYRSTI